MMLGEATNKFYSECINMKLEEVFIFLMYNKDKNKVQNYLMKNGTTSRD